MLVEFEKLTVEALIITAIVDVSTVTELLTEIHTNDTIHRVYEPHKRVSKAIMESQAESRRDNA